MDITGILFSLFCYINAVSGQNTTSTTTAPAPEVPAVPAVPAPAVPAVPAPAVPAPSGSTTGTATDVAIGTAAKSASSVSASTPDCAPPLKCPAVKCFFPVTPQGQCCPVCPSAEHKPGKCPVPFGAGHCAALCTGDSSCPGPLKCCSNGCGHDCMLPENFIVKPGKCPIPTGPGLCAESCFGDASCPGAMKCCSNGCGKDCMMPKRNGKDCIVDGKRYKDGETFKDRCNTCICDNGRSACTLIACPSSKPAKCPEPTTPGICILGCTSDWSCPETQKCCSNGCGLLCTLPIGGISSTPLCDGVFCPEVYCDDQFIPPGKCCNECPAPVPAY